MIGCVKCSNLLIINIDVKNNDFSCKDCSEKYELFFEKKILKIRNKKKELNFFISDLSNCDNEFSLKNVYEMYNKGYLDCIKKHNCKYNQSENAWQLSIKKLKSKIKANIENRISCLLNSNRENYFCSSCNCWCSDYEALKNNYSCIVCSNNLVTKNDFEEIDSLKNNLLNINNDWSLC